MSLKTFSRYFGWESLLIVSIYGGYLRVLPFSKSIIWSISLTAFCLSMLILFLRLSFLSVKIDKKSLIMLSLFFFMVGWAIISLLWSPISLSSLVINDAFIISVVLLPTISVLLGGELSKLEVKCLTGLLLVIVPIVIYTLFLWLTSDAPLRQVLLLKSQEENTGNIYLGIGIMLMLFGISCVLWSIYSRAYRWHALFLGVCAIYFCVQTGSRGPIVSGVLSLAFIAIVSLSIKRYISKTVLQLSFIISLLICVSFFLFGSVSKLQNDIQELGISQRFIADKERGYDESSSIGFRMGQYLEVISLTKDKPIIGNGALSYRKLTRFSENIYPHNIILDIWGDLGLIGLILFAGMLFLGLYGCYVIILESRSIFSLICVGIFLFFLFESQFSGYLYWSHLWIWLSIVVVSSGVRGAV